MRRQNSEEVQTWRTRRGEEEEEDARPVLTGDVQSGDIKVIFKNKGNCHYRVRSDAHVDGLRISPLPMHRSTWSACVCWINNFI